MLKGHLSGLRRILATGRRDEGTTPIASLYKRQFLREIDLFRDLSPEDLAWLEEITQMAAIPKGRVIYRQADTAESLFLLKRGKVRLSRLAPSGKKLDLAVLEPGTFFGEMPLLGERLRNADAEALDDCTLCVMSEADIAALVVAKPQVALRMLAALGRRLAESEARLEDLAYKSVRARLASALLRLGREHEGVVEGITHQELGDMVGAYRETVTKTLDELRAAGLVELGRRRIRLLDPGGLAALLEEG